MTTEIQALLRRWEERSRSAFPADAMLINLHIRELRELDATAAPVPDVEAEARRLFDLNFKSWRNCPPWEELHEQTRELWHAFALRRMTAAPVVVGEDMVRMALDAQPFADDNLGDRVWQLIGYDSDDAKKIIRAALTAALAGEVTGHPGTAPPEE